MWIQIDKFTKPLKFSIRMSFTWYSGGTEGRSVVVANRIWRGDCGKLTANEGDHRNIVEPYGGRIRYFIVTLPKSSETPPTPPLAIYNDRSHTEPVAWDKGWNLMINVKVDVQTDSSKGPCLWLRERIKVSM